MAIIKHISSKNASYSKVVEYLKYENDEESGKTIKKENGEMIERQNTIVSSLNCNPDTWAIECLEANQKYSKNQNKGDVKNHSYIISFSPEDKNKGLTLKKAHELGEEFAKRNLDGFQTLVCTHDNGHNGSGNIHVHIVINSVRVKEMEKKDYMTKKCDYAEGLKHRDTGKFRFHYANEIMKMCERENFHQVDLNKSKTGVSEKEYYAQKRGQDREKKIAIKEKREPTIFDTDKEELRQVINEAKIQTASIENTELRERAIISYAKKNYGVAINESRGRWSYKHPSWNGEDGKRSRPISDKKLGHDYRRENVIQYGSDKQIEWANSKGNTGTRRNTTNDAQKIKSDVRNRGTERIKSDIEQRKQEVTRIGNNVEKPTSRGFDQESRFTGSSTRNRG